MHGTVNIKLIITFVHERERRDLLLFLHHRRFKRWVYIYVSIFIIL